MSDNHVDVDDSTADESVEPQGDALSYPRLLSVVPADLEQVLADLDD